MKIQGEELTKLHLRRAVLYIPNHARGSITHPDVEHGVVSSFNEKYIFVRYVSRQGIVQATSAATNPENLRWE